MHIEFLSQQVSNVEQLLTRMFQVGPGGGTQFGNDTDVQCCAAGTHIILCMPTVDRRVQVSLAIFLLELSMVEP